MSSSPALSVVLESVLIIGVRTGSIVIGCFSLFTKGSTCSLAPPFTTNLKSLPPLNAPEGVLNILNWML